MMNDIVSIISTVGFPIAACIAMGVYVKDVTAKLTDIVIQNTTAMNRLADKIDDIATK